jgi:hypothetical protein
MIVERKLLKTALSELRPVDIHLRAMKLAAR